MKSTTSRFIETRAGRIEFPAYIPVTTFGTRFPLDDLIRPYLPRLAQAIMVSYQYAQEIKGPFSLPILLDSGGFASLFQGSRVVESRGLGMLEIEAEEETDAIHPRDVLELQERVADIAFTLDFPIPPGMSTDEAQRRQRLTIANARWALANRRRPDMRLFACVQAWDVESARYCARELAADAFDGFAIGGLVPRVRDLELVEAIIAAVRDEIGERPLHVFGIGKPDLVETLFAWGVDSVDSSSFVRLAADGRAWGNDQLLIKDPTQMDRLHLALCNLATASGRTLPLSASRLVFRTQQLQAR